MAARFEAPTKQREEIVTPTKQREEIITTTRNTEKNMETALSSSQITMASQNDSISKWKYDVFLSFRGEDTRNNFLTHLLTDRGINAFKDYVFPSFKPKWMFSSEIMAARYVPSWEEAPSKQREEIDARIDLTMDEASTKQTTSGDRIFDSLRKATIELIIYARKTALILKELAAGIDLSREEAPTKQIEEISARYDLFWKEPPTKQREEIDARIDLTLEEAPSKKRTSAEPTKDMTRFFVSYISLMKKEGFVRSALATLLATITFIAACVFPSLIANYINDYDTGRIVHGKGESAITSLFILLNSMSFVVSLAIVISSLRSFPSKPLPQISVSMFYVSYMCLIMKVSPWDAWLVLFLSVPLLLLAAAGKLCNYAE